MFDSREKHRVGLQMGPRMDNGVTSTWNYALFIDLEILCPRRLINIGRMAARHGPRPGSVSMHLVFNGICARQ